ncbi:hypothetical protein ACJJIW_20620 [Microbulbifer sp. JMSA004]|uniref:hypothetical protein n=1 Tax=Microbulbifer sp. JMSA004 TaxID=3243370 RepID=UPI004039E481
MDMDITNLDMLEQPGLLAIAFTAVLAVKYGDTVSEPTAQPRDLNRELSATNPVSPLQAQQAAQIWQGLSLTVHRRTQHRRISTQ